MKKAIIITILASAISCVAFCGSNASASSYAAAKETCQSGGATLNMDTKYCSGSMNMSGKCNSSGGTGTANGSGATCQWTTLEPATRSEAGEICSNYGGTFTASTATCKLFSYYALTTHGSCSSWGATSVTSGNDYSCKWASLAAGDSVEPTDPTDPGDDDGDGDEDGDDDDSTKVPLADVDEGKCSSILPDSWCKDGDGIGNIINLIVTVLTGAVVIAGTIGIIICGVLWMTARDNESQVVMAKKRMLDIVIGIVAWVLLALLANLFIPKSPESINSDAGISTTNNKDIEG